MSIQSINPVNGQILESFETHTSEEINSIVEVAHKTFLQWRDRSFSERATFMSKAANVLRNEMSTYARTMTMEMGKPITQSESEIEKCAWVCEYYAVNTEKILKEENVVSDASKSYVRYDPLGAVLAVMPWNFPFWQVFRFAAPALMAGNVGILKHASNVPRCGLMIEDVFKKAGFPENCFRTLMIGSDLVSEVIRHPKIVAVTLTGSEPAGSKVAEIAGKELKKTVLELGGSDPFLVLRDANLPEAAIVAASSRLINTGQSCIAAKRFIVEESVADQFESLFVKAMNKKKIGYPMNPETEIGPMAREDLVNEVEAQVQKSVEMGAKILLGGRRIDIEGAFYEPTILTDVKKGMPVFDEEVFGPVAAVIRVKDWEEAVAVANDSNYGLGASIWSQNIQSAEKIGRQIEAGNVFINGMVKSDPRLPFGGIKRSGYGRELASFGIREFVNIKTVWIK